MQVEIDQGEAGAQPVMVLGDPPVSHLVEAEDAFQDAEHMFYFRSYLVVFFRLASWSTWFLNFVLRQLISWACGAAWWIESVWP
jgi:hypothetical protein